MLIKRVEPVYPPDVQTEGTVQLHAIIGTDGSVLSVEYRSGPSELVQAAMDAVRQWRYRPFLLNGERVEVDTTIEVTFERPK
jgi:protein TonB